MKNAHNETKSLEKDSQKMEERLRELKMAMVQEKEQRELVTNILPLAWSEQAVCSSDVVSSYSIKIDKLHYVWVID